jgi:hypothetical protein
MVAEGTFATGLMSSYCGPADVTALLRGYDLARLGDAQALADRIGELLPITQQAVETQAGRDFVWHGGDTVVLDGSGSDRLSLVEAGTVPVAAVDQVCLQGRLLPGNERVLPASAYVVYPQAGEIRLLRGAGGGERFPRGRQNVSVTLDWGYEQPPVDVGLAQAKLTAAEVLAEATGETATAQSLTLGDYAVRYAAEGQYGAVISRLVAEAGELLRPYRRFKMRAI